MKARILKAENISPTAKLFTLEAGGDFSFIPGQYTAFNVNGAVRTYSICSLPKELPRFEFCVRQVPNGAGTEFLNEHVGREIELTAPAGDFIIKGTPASLLIIASGAGIAPVRPMLKDYLRHNPNAAIGLIYVLKGGEYLFQKEWEEMEREYSNFKISTSLPLRGISPRQGRRVFLVGSPPFVSQQLRVLQELGYNKQDIITDIWEA